MCWGKALVQLGDGGEGAVVVLGDFLKQDSGLGGDGLRVAQKLRNVAGGPAQGLKAQVGGHALQGVGGPEGIGQTVICQSLLQLGIAGVLRELADEFLDQAGAGEPGADFGEAAA